MNVKNAMIEQDFSDKERKLENARYEVQRLQGQIHQGIDREMKYNALEMRKAHDEVRDAEQKADKDELEARKQLAEEKRLGEKEIRDTRTEIDMQTKKYRDTEHEINNVRDVATNYLQNMDHDGTREIKQERSQEQE